MISLSHVADLIILKFAAELSNNMILPYLINLNLLFLLRFQAPTAPNYDDKKQN